MTGQELDELTTVWDRLDPCPDTVEGLHRLKGQAIIAPVSNGNYIDMVNLARYAGLPWDIILGSFVAQVYKPHPNAYLKSIAALGLQAQEVCMVAAHQAELPYAAGHGMQAAFVMRPDEFDGVVKPKNPQSGVSYLDAAEIYPEGDWTYITVSFIDLAEQVRQS